MHFINVTLDINTLNDKNSKVTPTQDVGVSLPFLRDLSL
jgi:hypothetical protein